MASARLPEGAYLKDISAWYNQNTIPRNLLATHSLPVEHWAAVVVEDGEVQLFLNGAKTPVIVTPVEAAVIAPETPFHVGSSGKPVRFCLHYFHERMETDPKQLAGMLGRGRVA
jgi:tellurite resistance-related uncharacterized protein